MRREWAFGPSQAAMVKGKTRPAANERPRARLNPSLSPPSPSAGWAASRATSRTNTQARAKERMASVDGMRGGTKTGRGGADAAGRVERKKENAGVMIGSGTKNLPAQKNRARVGPRVHALALTHTHRSRAAHAIPLSIRTPPLTSPPPCPSSSARLHLFFSPALHKLCQLCRLRRERVRRRRPPRRHPPPHQGVLYPSGLMMMRRERKRGGMVRNEGACACPNKKEAPLCIHPSTIKNSPAAPPGAPPSP